ncbi:HU family DNA-binding protein [Roseovarius sp. LXJ103]|nr:HU family DNA-binding protein [Roseovarius carneus]PWE37184.1 DNA-binding protein [Pelagicola sp. LXJ1103]
MGAGISDDTSPENSNPEMKKQELMAKVVERSDVAKKHAKPVIEAMLEVLGEAIAEGRALNLQPFGKLKHNRIKDTPAARIIVAKIRQPKPQGVRAGPGKEPVADEQE